METAHLLGTQAMRLGLETLDLASTHRQALATMEAAGTLPLEQKAMIEDATDFFNAALLPIEATHPTALESGAILKQLNAELVRITREMEDSAQDLERGIEERKAAEEVLKTSGERSAKLLDDSQRLYSDVQSLAHKILNANEEERRSLGCLLQDEIAQALLGVHVRLLVLRSEVAANSDRIVKEVDLAQRVVWKIVSTINRILRELDLPHES